MAERYDDFISLRHVTLRYFSSPLAFHMLLLSRMPLRQLDTPIYLFSFLFCFDCFRFRCLLSADAAVYALMPLFDAIFYVFILRLHSAISFDIFAFQIFL